MVVPVHSLSDKLSADYPHLVIKSDAHCDYVGLDIRIIRSLFHHCRDRGERHSRALLA